MSLFLSAPTLYVYGTDKDSILSKIRLECGVKGFQAATTDGLDLLQIEIRDQFRIAYPSNTNPITYNTYNKETIYMGINRARVKIGGQAYRKLLKYNTEYELFSAVLLNFELK